MKAVFTLQADIEIELLSLLKMSAAEGKKLRDILSGLTNFSVFEMFSFLPANHLGALSFWQEMLFIDFLSTF